MERSALVPTSASGQPGFARYADEHETGVHEAYGVTIFALRDDRVAGITGISQDRALRATRRTARSHARQRVKPRLVRVGSVGDTPRRTNGSPHGSAT